MPASPASTIEESEDELRRAMLAANVDALDRLLDDQLLFVGPDGTVFRKQDDLAAHRRGAWRFARLDVIERSIEAGETLAVTATLAELEGTTSGGGTFGGRVRYSRTWRRGGDGGWRVVGGAVVPVSPPR